jgi:predicted HicB family RNase H-like nuclease
MFLLSYKGYSGYAQVNSHNQIYGNVMNLKEHIISFKAETKEEAQQAFIEAINDYLQFCQDRGITPEQPESFLGNYDE